MSFHPYLGPCVRQREVFAAVAPNEVPIDAVALLLDSKRGAVYKTLVDARMKLRPHLADADYPIDESTYQR